MYILHDLPCIQMPQHDFAKYRFQCFIIKIIVAENIDEFRESGAEQRFSII